MFKDPGTIIFLIVVFLILLSVFYAYFRRGTKKECDQIESPISGANYVLMDRAEPEGPEDLV